MSTLHHETILETCFDEAIIDFCEANDLTPEMFAQIEKHEGVQIALAISARAKFDDLCI